MYLLLFITLRDPPTPLVDLRTYDVVGPESSHAAAAGDMAVRSLFFAFGSKGGFGGPPRRGFKHFPHKAVYFNGFRRRPSYK